jgi:tripartite-type tricarboxylate transporter receptor subunit TctC
MNRSRVCNAQRLRLFCMIAAFVAGLPALGEPVAQPFPSRPLRIVLGFPPGTTVDAVTRIVAEKMGEELGQILIIENRPGAGQTIATQAVARATPDGYTLTVDGCSAAGIVYAFVMTDRPPLDPFKDFAPVGRVMRDHWLVAVSPVLGVSSVKELVALGKAKPGALTFPSSGVGSSQHLQSERFRMRVGIEALHVSYKDSALADLTAGRLSFTVQPSPALVPQIKAGRLKALAVLSTERIAPLPDVPTAAEAGLPDLIYNAGICLYATGGTPRTVLMRLNSALNKAEAAESVKKRFADLGLETVQGSPEDTAKFIKELMAQVDQLRVAVFGKAR